MTSPTISSPTLERKSRLFGVIEPLSLMPLPEDGDLQGKVLSLVRLAGFIPEALLERETEWFFHNLGLGDFYFQTTSVEEMSHHLTALYAAKLLAVISPQEGLALNLSEETSTRALYLVPSQPGNPQSPCRLVEWKIEARYLKEGYRPNANEADLTGAIPGKLELVSRSTSASRMIPAQANLRLQVYRTSGTVGPHSKNHLRMFVIEPAQYAVSPDEIDEAECDIEKICDRRFLSEATPNTLELFRRVVKEAATSLGPTIFVSEGTLPGEIRLMMAYRHGATHSFFTSTTALYHSRSLFSNRKYVETLANNLSVHTLFLSASGDQQLTADQLLERGQLLVEDLSLAWVLPRTSLFPLFASGLLDLPQITYAYVIWKFAHQFLNTLGLEPALRGGDIGAPADDKESSQRQAAAFRGLRASLRRDAYTESRLSSVVAEYTDVIRELYAEFVSLFDPSAVSKASASSSSSSSSSSSLAEPHFNDSIDTHIRRAARTELDRRVLATLRIFNKHVLKTNFFKKSKVALSFRLRPDFLSEDDYPVRPFAVFFIVGAEFRGFHVRFADIARGGIRLIRSGDASAFASNVSTMFDENYNLALTQQKKNKDIPEGGSKGTILLSLDHQDKGLVAFKKYVDALLDLLVIEENSLVDYYRRPEVLFLGPDEGTADMMDWASSHARTRNYPFWKSFTTGKSPQIGGIPHDLFGMTTRGVHQFVLGIYRKLGLDEAKIFKFQTGGPDGDLGSNEIKISHDRTVAIVDGSGVLYDPSGLDRDELLRLATGRLMSEHFNKSKLGSDGFFVHVNDVDVTLPDGRQFEKGLLLRNSFHLDPVLLNAVDLFVPCGGRPAAVNSSNVKQLWSAELGRPRFRFIVEGANLFFTHEARLQMEEWGVVVFKDASANKGGVTSSSLEVLAALSLSDTEFAEHMQAVDPLHPPAFYKTYVEHVQQKVEALARDEFEAIWREHERTGQPRTILSDLLSEKINSLSSKIAQSSLWDNVPLRQRVIAQHVPKPLVDLVGIDRIVERVPVAYLQAIFGSTLAAQFIYTRGLDAGEFGFYEFMLAHTSAQ